MLSKKTKYAFSALTYLIEHKEDGPVLIQEISRRRNISQKFLENILLELRKAGILGSKKGKGGGYYIIKEPAEVPLAKIIRLVNGPIALVPCVSLNYYERCSDCPSEETCRLHTILEEVRDHTLQILEGKTLADLVNPSKIEN